jgi:transcriptional regulator with XRE-family HTH domain
VLSKQQEKIFKKKLGELVRSARLKANVKQEVLSTQLGFKSRISVANIENGNQNIQLITLIEISDYLQIPISDLIPPIDSIKSKANPALIKQIAKEGIKGRHDSQKIFDFIHFITNKK